MESVARLAGVCAAPCGFCLLLLALVMVLVERFVPYEN